MIQADVERPTPFLLSEVHGKSGDPMIGRIREFGASRAEFQDVIVECLRSAARAGSDERSDDQRVRMDRCFHRFAATLRELGITEERLPGVVQRIAVEMAREGLSRHANFELLTKWCIAAHEAGR